MRSSTPAARLVIGLCSLATLIAIGFALAGYWWTAVVALLSPLLLVVIVFTVYGLFALVAFGWGRLDTLRHPRKSGRTRHRSDPHAREQTPLR